MAPLKRAGVPEYLNGVAASFASGDFAFAAGQRLPRDGESARLEA
jgi:hypothetical protein